MTNEEIQEWADENKLDVMPMSDDRQWRLLDNYGERVLDIYFKWNKRKTNIVKNSTLRWRDEKWFYPTTLEELNLIIK